MQANRVTITRPGPPEVLRYGAYELPPPGPGEALIRQSAIGLNFVDIQHRSGRYPLPHYPAPIGTEAAGVVAALGDGVAGIAVGDRVAYSSLPVGAYADFRTIAAERLVPLPPGISESLAASVMTKGLTAHYLLFTTHAVKAGDTILVHAAAGGVGNILCQWAKHLGATVIGTVGSEDKAAFARQSGCDFPILYAEEDFADAVLRITGGKGVPVVYDGVGKDTYENSLRCLAPRGLLVSFGTASGPIPPFDLFRLNRLGSLYVTSPAFVTHTTERAELLARAGRLFAALEAGTLQVRTGDSYQLSEAAAAHRELAARRLTGSTILVP